MGFSLIYPAIFIFLLLLVGLILTVLEFKKMNAEVEDEKQNEKVKRKE
jgi:regulatory protein YycI of two-component signal transduction system YycFG